MIYIYIYISEGGKIFILDPLDVNESTYKEFINHIQR
jgi:hypothetical protein